ncbi:MAG: hypothetical protein ACTTKL_00250 [Treponema sp.]
MRDLELAAQFDNFVAELGKHVFLKTAEDKIASLNSVIDKTQLEAHENHVHLCGKIKKSGGRRH